MKLLCPIGPNSCHQLLQHDLDLVFRWCSRWNMSLNTSECYVLYVPCSRLTEPPPPPLILNGALLSFVYDVRDLGVFYDFRLKLAYHVETIVKRANGRIARFQQIFRSRHKSVVLHYHLLYVRPRILPFNQVGCCPKRA
eukprot:GHVN01048777.1.p1 GENE.GHVN01048777.1~~GHVN01048777.1.p1  ORF type:complete len:139 (+),score=1.63 GHVN01048777.1:295-711(+)